MPQLASSKKFEAESPVSSEIFHEEERTGLEQRCRQLEMLVSELLLKNQTLRMQLAAGPKEER